MRFDNGFCTWIGGRCMLPVVALAFLAAGADLHAQETVYKWVDQHGVVHFSDEPPSESEAVSVEVITTASAPSRAPPVPAPAAEPPDDTRVVPDEPAASAAAPRQPSPVKVDITTMSIEALDLRCEQARERKIKPLREAEIVKCKDQGETDPAWCERYYADYGAGGKTTYGGYHPRMFHDLPECLEADEERRRRF